MVTCPNCGAPLPAVAPGEVERCPFCSVETREPAPPPPPPPPPAWEPEPLPATTAIPPGLALAITAGVFLLVAGLALSIVHDCGTHAPTVTINIPPLPSTLPVPRSPPRPSTVSPKPSAAATPVSLVALAGGSFPDSQPLDAPPILGPADNFDAVKNVDWATALGTTWSPDAKLFRIETSRVAKDGTLDVSRPFHGGMTESAVTYVFIAGRQQLQLELNASWVHPAAVAAAPVPYVTVRTGAASALPTERPVPRPTCTLRQAFASLAKGGVLVPSQAYQANLRDNGVGPWWVVSFAVVSATGSVKGVEGLVSASTCAIVHDK